MYKFRIVKPHLTDWIESEGASFGAVIQQWHYDYHRCFDFSIRVELPDGGKEIQSFALFERDNGEQWISRVCSVGIMRKGGVQLSGRETTLEDVAKALEVSFESLLGPWELEEQYL